MTHLPRRRALLAATGALALVSASAARFLAAPVPVLAAMFPAEGPKVPQGLVPIHWPKENPYSPAKAELGWLLYFDKRMSVDGTVACASCHDPKHAFTDGSPFSKGIRGQLGGRSAPTIINRAYSLEQFWDGRAKTLEEQAKGPIANPIEMGHAHDLCEKCIACDRGLSHAIQGGLRRREGHRSTASPRPSPRSSGQSSLATRPTTSSRPATSRHSPTASSAAWTSSSPTTRGAIAATKGSTSPTASTPTSASAMDKPEPDLGRFAVTKQEEDRGAFKTPTLREIAHTGPYMHDGSMKTLEEVVDHYSNGGIGKSGKKPVGLHQDVRPLNLKDQDKKDLVEFLKALSGEGWQHIKPPEKLPE